MTIESLLALAVAVALFAATPGPAVFAILARTLAGGFGPGVLFLLGCVLGDVLYLILAVVGLGYVASALGNLFVLIKIVGAAYLAWLGIKLWRAPPVVPGESEAPRQGLLRGLGEGLLVTLGSPKAILFFGALLPTFVDVPSLAGGDIVLVAAVVAIGIVSINGLYVAAAARARRFFRSRRSVRWLNRTTGTVMIGTGVALANR